MADWSSTGTGVSVNPFHERLGREDDVAERLRNFDVIVAMRERTAFPATLLERLPLLKLIVTTGKRNAAIDVKAAGARGVVVCGRARSTPPAELTWGLILSLARSIPRESAAMRTGAWQSTIGVGLHGKTLGVIGLGRLRNRRRADWRGVRDARGRLEPEPDARENRCGSASSWSGKTSCSTVRTS